MNRGDCQNFNVEQVGKKKKKKEKQEKEKKLRGRQAFWVVRKKTGRIINDFIPMIFSLRFLFPPFSVSIKLSFCFLSSLLLI